MKRELKDELNEFCVGQTGENLMKRELKVRKGLEEMGFKPWISMGIS
jgi:hypothetical protein